ncbi:MAG: hypothetical protein PHI55_12185, partial [Burkholderiaceae bacterium]|nr:hypothetical protein [Burkholderiaceae bacterium]
SSDSAVATATVAGDSLTVTGGATPGTATITVIDLADTRQAATLVVTVTAKPVVVTAPTP